MGVLEGMFGSKKFWYSIVGVVIAIIGNLKPEWADTVQQMLYGVIALVLGQGMADINKEAAKIEAGEEE